MTTTSQAYDHPTYTARQSASFTSTAGAGGVGCRFTAFTGMLAWSATATVTTAGTSVGAGAAAIIQKVSGTTTSTLGTITLGSSTANTVVNLALSTVTGGVTMLQGDRLIAVNGTDATSAFSLAFEVSVIPEATVTL
jgi:hypothetical protein